jgi:hypothetical protein
MNNHIAYARQSHAQARKQAPAESSKRNLPVAERELVGGCAHRQSQHLVAKTHTHNGTNLARILLGFYFHKRTHVLDGLIDLSWITRTIATEEEAGPPHKYTYDESEREFKREFKRVQEFKSSRER